MVFSQIIFVRFQSQVSFTLPRPKVACCDFRFRCGCIKFTTKKSKLASNLESTCFEAKQLFFFHTRSSASFKQHQIQQRPAVLIMFASRHGPRCTSLRRSLKLWSLIMGIFGIAPGRHSAFTRQFSLVGIPPVGIRARTLPETP